MLRKIFLLAGLVGLMGIQKPVQADVVAYPLTYNIGNQEFEGYVARNEGFGDNQPIVLLVHDWDGLSRYEQMRANMLSTQGYTVFAVDLYGQGVRPKNTAEAQAESGKLYGDRQLMRDRLMAALSVAERLEGVDPSRVAVIGYCFGGAAVLEMARAGADLDGFVSFHGSLDLPEGQDYSETKGAMLVLHGSADPVAPMSEVAALATDLNEAGVTYDMEIYGGALHSFTKWDSSDYDPQADLKSWDELLEFLGTIF
ncbi:dienelactone hydrolase family protein [Synechococcus moorigangaii CMS01]|nr:dienelactone hydrolase family protein [Synechococcus moorigangaii CMS01]